MTYEVIKRRGKRAYRYAVEYYHDADGKGRTRWQYLGPVNDDDPDGAATPRLAKNVSTSTSSRLLDALERLLIKTEYSDITASAIAIEAEVAHGTFYRHFKDKRDALRASMQRLAERAEHLATLTPPGPDREVERQRMRSWFTQRLTTVGEHPSIWRAWTTLSESDASVGEMRRMARAKYHSMLQEYLEQLQQQGLTDIKDAYHMSSLIFTVMYGVLQDRFVHDEGMPKPEIIEYVCSMIDRTIFHHLTPAAHHQQSAITQLGPDLRHPE